MGGYQDSGIPPHTPRRLSVVLPPTHSNMAELGAATAKLVKPPGPASFGVNPRGSLIVTVYNFYFYFFIMGLGGGHHITAHAHV